MQKKYSDHMQRWDIQESSEKELRRFQFRLKEPLVAIERAVTREGERLTLFSRFNYWLGEGILSETNFYGDEMLFKALGPDAQPEGLEGIIEDGLSFKVVVHRLQMLFFAMEELKYKEYIETLFAAVKHELISVPSMNVRAVKSGNSVILYPSGVELLDEKLINETLHWLEPYDSVSKHFERALTMYLEGGEDQILLNELRHAIEALLKKVLGNRKGLENQKDDLYKWLKARGTNVQTANLYNGLLFGPYRIFQNDEIKHGDGINFTKEEVEYFIYLTGAFIRLVVQLERNNFDI